MGFWRRPFRWASQAAFLVFAVGTCATPSRSESWTETRPEDVARFSLERISFEGSFATPTGELEDVIKSSTSGIFRFRPVNLERLEGDVLRLRNHLRRRGYWNAQIHLRILFEHEKRRTHAIFEITEGAQRFVGDVHVQGNQTFDTGEIASWTEQMPGEPFDLSSTDRDRTSIENRYANEGFYLVRVVADIQTAEAPGDSIVHDLVHRISEGPRFFVGSISFAGNEFTKEEILRREITLSPGEILSRERIDESRARLYATGYFSRVEILPQDVEASRGEIDVVVRVVERTMRFVGAGVGYGTRDQLRLSGEWGHRNLWGRGKRANVRGILASELFPADLVRTRLEGRYVEPRLFETRTTATAELFYERRRELFNVGAEEGEYDLSLVGLITNLNRPLTRFTRGWVSVENEWADLDAGSGTRPPDSERPDLTRTITLTLERDRRNDYFNPEKGFLNRLIGSVSGGLLGGDNDFWKTQLEMSWFRLLRSTTLAGRVRVGYERTFGQSETVPDRQRFKLGGSTSVRGYREREIGPGDFLLLSNVEARFPLFWIVGGAIFVDGGNAWEEPTEVRWKDFRIDTKDDPARSAETDFRYAVGAGVRLRTPVGPVRLDWGWKLKRLPVEPDEDEEDRWRLHLSLGNVF
jgi:outer membrane protein insertion porin family